MAYNFIQKEKDSLATEMESLAIGKEDTTFGRTLWSAVRFKAS